MNEILKQKKDDTFFLMLHADDIRNNEVAELLTDPLFWHNGEILDVFYRGQLIEFRIRVEPDLEKIHVLQTNEMNAAKSLIINNSKRRICNYANCDRTITHHSKTGYCRRHAVVLRKGHHMWNHLENGYSECELCPVRVKTKLVKSRMLRKVVGKCEGERYAKIMAKSITT